MGCQLQFNCHYKQKKFYPTPLGNIINRDINKTIFGENSAFKIMTGWVPSLAHKMREIPSLLGEPETDRLIVDHNHRVTHNSKKNNLFITYAWPRIQTVGSRRSLSSLTEQKEKGTSV